MSTNIDNIKCIRHIYDKYFENPVPENMPLLEDLYDALLTHKNPKAERIANSLVLYVHGSQNYFNIPMWTAATVSCALTSETWEIS